MALWRPFTENSSSDLSETAVRENQPEISEISYVTHFQGFNYEFYPHIAQVSHESTYLRSDSIFYGPSTSKPVVTSQILSPRSLKSPYTLVETDCLSDDPDFQELKRTALKVMAEKNGGALIATKPRTRRASLNSGQDEAYRQQRKKNNYAAKKSRAKRKLREIDLSLKVKYLKKQVAALKANLSTKVCEHCQLNCLCC